MARASDILAGVAIGAFIGLGASIALAPAPASADAGYKSGTETISSNKAKKGDLLVTQEPTRVERNILPSPVEVHQVQVLGNQDASIVLIDGSGRIVYRSDPALLTTSIARDAVVPLARNSSINRIDVAFRTADRNS